MCSRVVAGSVDETVQSIFHWVSCSAEKIYILLCLFGVFSKLHVPTSGIKKVEEFANRIPFLFHLL